MRFFTVFLQFICVVLGILFTGADFFKFGKLGMGGLVFGSLMFLSAVLLGADHNTNSSYGSRRIFKGLALLLACPIILIGVLECYKLLVAGQWLDSFSSGLRLLVFFFAVLFLAFDHHPIVRRTMTQFGFSTPKK
nr:hypothetical protein [uncultured Noviherbaspirillum sp.]